MMATVPIYPDIKGGTSISLDREELVRFIHDEVKLLGLSTDDAIKLARRGEFTQHGYIRDDISLLACRVPE